MTDLAVDCINPNVTKPGKPNLTALVGTMKRAGGSGSDGSGASSGRETPPVPRVHRAA